MAKVEMNVDLPATNREQATTAEIYWDTEDDLITWRCNNRTPFEDMLTRIFETWGWSDEHTARALRANKEARSAEAAKLIEQYRQAEANRTPEQIAEQRYEARAAMGPGVEMVNVITGERYTT